MTSRFATNYISSGVSRKHYLESNRDGFPLQNQIPRTIQTYSGNGNQTIPLTTYNVLSIDSVLNAGPLTLTCIDTPNYFGRLITIESLNTITNNIVINYGAGRFIRVGIDDVVLPSTYTIPAGTPPFKLDLDFMGYDLCNVSFGSGIAVRPADFASLNISTNALNDLNTALGQAVLWSPIVVGSSSLQANLGAGAQIESFTTTRAGFIEVQSVIGLNGNLLSEFIASLELDGVVQFEIESVQGLASHVWSCSKIFPVAIGQVIRIFSANASGPVAAMIPASNFSGSLSIKYI